MKLYITLTSPYARLARISAIEHGLTPRLDIQVAATRQADSPYYAINPSGRVPCLIVNEGMTLEDSRLICTYFDSIGDGPRLLWSPDHDAWRYGALEAQAQSFLDGIAVLGRELRRPPDEQSPTIVSHERARAQRLADTWLHQLHTAIMTGPLNMAQLILVSAIDAANQYFGWDALSGRPQMAAWSARMHERASIAATMPGDPL